MTEHKLRAICVLHPNKHNITGIIKFSQNIRTNKVRVDYNVTGLSDGKHGFHIHEYGNLTDGCSSACAHFNPHNEVHGGRKSKKRHVGDLGNISSTQSMSKGFFYDHMISLDTTNECSIIGRAIIIHKDPDDLGKGDNDESLKTGNAGKRLACGVIGICK